MNHIPNYIENNILQVIRKLSAKFLIENREETRTKMIKVYQSETDIIYQVKNTVTKKAVRFLIPLEPKEGLVATLVMRSKNPNTIEYFDDFYSIKNTINIFDINKLEQYFITAKKHLNSFNPSLKIPFEKIKTTKNKEEVTGHNLLLKTIESVKLVDVHYEIKFKEDQSVLTIDKDIKFKLPFSEDLMFQDISGKYQFYSQAKARYHFELN